MTTLDALVRGRAGFTERTVEGRIYRLSHYGWVGIVDAEQRQWVVHEPEVIGDPRPVNGRSGIPARLT